MGLGHGRDLIADGFGLGESRRLQIGVDEVVERVKLLEGRRSGVVFGGVRPCGFRRCQIGPDRVFP